MELQHHGILGQKWGKRNGPPYPLGSYQYTRLEKKLNRKVSDIRGDIDRIEKRREKVYKYQKKADTKKYGMLANKEKAKEYQDKAQYEQYKANKDMYRVNKKIKKLRKRYESELLRPLFDIPEDILDAGETYANLLSSRTISSL